LGAVGLALALTGITTIRANRLITTVDVYPDDRMRRGDAQPQPLAWDTASRLGTCDLRVLNTYRHAGAVIPGANTLFVWSGIMFGIAFAGLDEEVWRSSSFA
jgi:hypothetical protein